MPHPWQRLSEPTRCRWFTLATVLSFAWMVVLFLLGRPLDATGYGIVAFELAGDLPCAQCIMEQWNAAGVMSIATWHLLLDFGFLLSYATALSLGCVLACRPWGRVHRCLAWLGVVLAWAALLAGLLDVVENLALLSGLHGAAGAWWPPLARYCALPKFALVLLAALFVLTGGVVCLLHSRPATP
jgi:hypothetical protein